VSSTDAAEEAATDADAEALAEVPSDDVRVRPEANAREEAEQAPADEDASYEDASHEDAEASSEDTPATSATPSERQRSVPDAEPAPPVGRPGTTRRNRDARDDDPWQSLREDEDEAMLGAWTHRDGLVGTDVTSREGPRGTFRAAPPASAPGGRLPGATAPAFDPSDPPQAGFDRDELDHELGDDDDEDEGWTYGLRDPFVEAERHERAVRRWALLASLLVALGIFLVLQWAYSRPGPNERTPPPYAAGLTAYREGAFVSAARAWAPRAEAGDTDAMFMLGWMAEYGQGRPWSNREAAGWYAQAAQRGHAPSQLRLADLYAQGLGVAFDPDVATRWYLAAAEAGLPRAQREAALAMAREGRHAEAAEWLDSAAAHDPDAAAWLALMDAARTLNPRSE